MGHYMNEDGLWILDSEADGLLDEITKFHCLCFKKYGEDKWMMFLDEKHPEAKEAYNYCVNIREEKITVRRLSTFNEWVVSGDVKALACHFMFGFDLPAFNKILGTTFDFFPENINGQPIRLYDTLSISRNLNPDRPLPDGCPSKIRCPVSGKLKSVGAHGLQAWGYRINNMKPAIDDWRNQPLVTYINRVIEDVHINEGTWTLLKKEAQPNEAMRIDWNVPLWRGMASDYLMAEQERQGVVFDKEKAIILRDRIDVMMAEIEEDVEPQLPERLLPKSKQPVFPKEPFKQDGSISGTGINWLKRLGYEFDQDILDVTPPPKTAFKGDGSLSKAGENYCIKHGVEERDKMAMFIREQLAKSQQSIFKGGAQAEYCGKQDLRAKKMPKLTEPMRLSNQLDIKKYLVEVEGWKPTIMGTRIGFDVDDRKRKLPDDILIPKIKKYIMDVYNSPFREFIYEELGYEFHKLKEDTLIDRLKKKARYLPSTPKFKDQRGELCPNLELLKGEMAKKIVKWLSLRNRRSVLESPDEGKDTGWLKNPRLEVDGKLGAGMSGLTNTTRYSHITVVNVPKNDPDVLLGKEMRELFTVPEGYWQIGTDASNLEGFVAAWLAWDFDKGEYYRGLSGDPHCYTGDVEVLTFDRGWVRFDELQEGELVAQYHKEGHISFVEPSEIVRMPFKGDMYKFTGRGMDLDVTYNHRMVEKDVRRKGLKVTLAKDYSTTNGSTRYLTNAVYDGSVFVNTDLMRLAVAVQADGSLEGNKVRIELRKECKKQRLELLLRDCSMKYTKTETRCGGHRYSFDYCFSYFLDEDKNFQDHLIHIGIEDKDVFLEELQYWDGWEYKRNYFYSQTGVRRKSVEVVNTIASLANRKTYVCKVPEKKGEGSAHYCSEQLRVTFSKNLDTGFRGNTSLTKEKYRYEGMVYCVTVPTSLIMVRRNGKICVSGNTANAEAYSIAAGREVGRGEGKAITYGSLYGAQAAKISSMLGIPKDKAQGVIDAYWDTNYGLKGAKEALEKYWEKTGKKYIRSIDGRKIYTRSKHSLLNARIQSTGAILMAVAGNIWHEKASKAGLLEKGVARVVYMHDEYQHQIPEDLIRWKKFDTKEEAENYSVDGFILSGNVKEIDGKWCRIWTKAGQLMVEAIEEAARQLGCPFRITGEYLYGKRWSACH